MTNYGKAFFISLALYVTGCVYVNVSDDKTATEEAPIIDATSEESPEN